MKKKKSRAKTVKRRPRPAREETTASAVLEVGLEEVPARFWPDIIAEVEARLAKKLDEENLPRESLRVLATSRRLAVVIGGLKTRQDDQILELKGPPAKAAYDEKGRLTQAGAGFARSQGALAKNLFSREVDGRPYLFARVKRKGQPAEEVLARIFPEVLSAVSLPITMRWGEGQGPFIRPVHWLMGKLGRKQINFSWLGIKSGKESRGHRFLAGGFFTLARAADYEEALLGKKVMVDQKKRADRIREEAAEEAAGLSAEPLLDEALLEELTFLGEFPGVLAGSFDSEFLKMPPQIPVMVMRKYQRAIPLKKNGELLPYFLLVADGLRPKNRDNIRRGNEIVLRSRLADARFFYDEDRKIPLENWAEKLGGIAWQNRLGTLADKAQRIEKLAGYILSEGCPGKTPLEKYQQEEKIRQAARLCKADIPTHLAGEFSDLQGVAGRLYAASQGIDREVAQAIEEHLWPRFTGDRLSESFLARVVGLADRLDSLAGYLGQGIKMSGSQDPYGLRRLGAGLIKILLQSEELEMSLVPAVEFALKNYESQKINLQAENVRRTLLPLLAQRLRQELLDSGCRYDLVDAALAVLAGEPQKAREVVEALQSISTLPWFKELVDTGVRVYRLSADFKGVEVEEEFFVDLMEKELWQKYLNVNNKVTGHLVRRDYRGALAELAKLAEVIDRFFVKIMVMVEEEGLKNNRLAMLKKLDQLYKQLADFNQIVQ